jgi:hypothetical protein
MIGSDPVATFYLPFTRAWELLAGAVLAFAWDRFDQSEAASNRRAWSGLALIAVSAAALNTHRAFPGWWALLPVAGSALLLSAPASWINRAALSWRPVVGIGLISYPLYLWHWPLLVMFTAIRFEHMTSIQTELTLLLSALLAWGTYQFVEKPFRFGRPIPFKAASLAGAMAVVAIAGIIVVRNGGFDSRLPPDIQALARVTTEAGQWRVHRCMLDLSHETTFGEECVEHGRRPLLLLWGDSTAGSLMPGLRKAQERHGFALAQLTSSSCAPALHAEIAITPGCRAINDKVMAMVRQLQPDIVLLHGANDKVVDNVVETVATLKRDTRARVVVLGPEPFWDRGLPNEVLRYYLLYHRLMPARATSGFTSNWADAPLREKLEPKGAEFISAWDALCNKEGCLARVGDAASDLTASDAIHLTEKGSIFVIDAIIDRILNGPAQPRAASKQD